MLNGLYNNPIVMYRTKRSAKMDVSEEMLGRAI